VGKIGQEAAALGSALKSQAQDLVEEFRKTARELTELEGHRVWLESELESSVIRETDAVAAMAAYKAQLLRDTELERGCANGLVKALFDALWLAQEAINTLLCDCECDARPSVAADDSRGAGDRGDAEDGAGRRALVRLIPPPAAQQLEVQCEAELPAVPNVEETREQTVLDAQERVPGLFLCHCMSVCACVCARARSRTLALSTVCMACFYIPRCCRAACMLTSTSRFPGHSGVFA
jgi:hypothetical protein